HLIRKHIQAIFYAQLCFCLLSLTSFCAFRKSMTEYDPRLVAPTCLYLASKAEESTVQARLLVFYLKKLYADEKYRYDRYEIKEILEMEMKILEALNYYLVDLLLIIEHCLSKYFILYIIYLKYLLVKNISMEILDFYENHRMITDDRIIAAFSKLNLKQ
ncbi:cyclin-C1-2-like, partial [Quercus lobata]|uniref:cyclin-C1-2-like n=1 Tax=Quercus lobata TaxID=97700 RepID=UPI0012456F13